MTKRYTLDADPAGHGDITDVPQSAFDRAVRIRDEHMAAHDRHYPPTHDYAGSNSERAYIGLPGHCSVCAIVGHVEAHPERGCGDVGCTRDH